MKKPNISMLAVMVFISGCVEKHEKTGRQNSTVENLEERVESLLKMMTVEEKIGQMNQYSSRWEMTGPAPGGDENTVLQDIKSGRVGSMLNVVGARATREAQKLAVENSRLGIPMIFGYDVVHGFRTIFPIPLGEAASWDPEAVRKSSAVAAREAAAAGLHWTFAPVLDISRDARWGRVMEGSGEDPYLVSVLAAARVRGFQGDDLSSTETIAACAKHFAAHGFAESGRDYNSVDISETTLREVVLPPFRAAVEAGVATFMNAFNTISGVPATAHHHLLRDILKGEWNFDGFVVSDWGSIQELISHGVASNKQEAALMAVRAGTDMDLEGACYLGLAEMVKNGVLDQDLIDDAVRRILRIKFRLGLFDDPYQYSDPVREINTLLSHENLAVSREVARKSIVLLKNDRNLLPLIKRGQNILVVGELAESKDVPLGSWRASAIPNSAVSLLEGIRQAVTSPESVAFEKGPVYIEGQRTFTSELKFNLTDRKGIPEAVAAASRADVVVMALGEDCFQSGEGRSQTEIGLKGLQEELLEAVIKVNKNVVVVLMNGRPLDITCMAEAVPAILETWHLGSQAGAAIADVLFGDYNPSGKLPVTFPRSAGQLPLYYNHLSTGRPEKTDIVFWSHYTDELNEPLFPFGFGLSYTTFEYSDLRLSSNKMKLNGKIKVFVKVKNTGTLAGEEVVQMYTRDLVGSVSRPVKELKGFRKVMILPGETAEVEFSLEPENLAFYHPDGRWTVEPGQFRLWVGPDSSSGLEAGFEIE
jgi:beta-glucosidase